MDDRFSKEILDELKKIRELLEAKIKTEIKPVQYKPQIETRAKRGRPKKNATPETR